MLAERIGSGVCMRAAPRRVKGPPRPGLARGSCAGHGASPAAITALVRSGRVKGNDGARSPRIIKPLLRFELAETGGLDGVHGLGLRLYLIGPGLAPRRAAMEESGGVETRGPGFAGTFSTRDVT